MLNCVAELVASMNRLFVRADSEIKGGYQAEGAGRIHPGAIPEQGDAMFQFLYFGLQRLEGLFFFKNLKVGQ